MKKIFKSIITIMLVMSVMVCNSGTVAYAATKSISVKTNKSTLYIMDSANNKAKLTTTYNGKNVTKSAKYRSSNNKIAKVNKSGIVTALRPGTVKITTKYKGKSKTTKVTVKKAKLSLNKKSLQLTTGQKFTLKAFANKSTISNKNIKWTSSNDGVATVNKNGILTTKKSGTTTISCKTTIGKASVKVVVKKNATNATTTAQENTSINNGDTGNTNHEHHWVTVEDKETIPAVTKWQIQCPTCGKWFDSQDELDWHQVVDTDGACGGCDPSLSRQTVITPAKEITVGTHEECSICHQRK